MLRVQTNVAVFSRVSIVALAFVASWVVDTLAVVTRSTSAVVSWHVTPVARPAEVTVAGEAWGTVDAIAVITDANRTVVNLCHQQKNINNHATQWITKV